MEFWKNKKIKFIELNKQKFKISSVKIIVLSYFIDFLINFLFSMILMFLLTSFKFLSNHYALKIIIMFIFNAFFLFFYFTLIPFWFNYTLGRLICRIKFINIESKIKFKILFLREFIVIMIPYLAISIFNFVVLLIYKINILQLDQKIKLPQTILFLISGFNFAIMIYYSLLLISIILDKNNQISIDYKFNLFFVRLIKNKKIIKTKTNYHVHLGTNLPCNISKENLDAIKKMKKY